jgi:quinoprotein glucose dehydrogenase
MHDAEVTRLELEKSATSDLLAASPQHPPALIQWRSIAVDPVREVAFTTPAYLAFISRLIPR